MKIFGNVVYLVFQVIVFVFEIFYLYTWLGAIGVILGFVLFPVVWAALPFIMLFRSGIWLPLVVTFLPLLIGIFKFKK